MNESLSYDTTNENVAYIIIFVIILVLAIILTAVIVDYRNTLQTLTTQLNNPCSLGFNEEKCDAHNFGLWCTELAQEGIEQASVCREYCNNIKYPHDSVKGEKERFCSFKTVCQGIGTENNDFRNYCASCSPESVFRGDTPVNFCDSFDFNYICFNYPTLAGQCSSACVFPENFPNEFSEYVYCSILPDFKELNPCFESFTNPLCMANEKIQAVFCTNNEEYCSHAPNYISNKFINGCYCRCLLGGENCKSDICRNTLSEKEFQALCSK